jgi:(S)-2-hydroxyglutarate dehydrogenase
MPHQTSDFLIVGGGIIGINIALELKRRFADATVHLMEKESSGTEHGSGRNSGVLHAGFYYTADSLKAKFTRDGNRLLTNYCIDNSIPINRCGKLVVAQTEADLASLDELLRRGKQNGVELYDISEDEAIKIEARAKTVQRAIFSPTTSSVDPASLVKAMEQDAKKAGVVFHHNTEYRQIKNGSIDTGKGIFSAGYIVNAAGLYADKLARDFGFSEKYRILPFKGIYLYSDEISSPIRTHVYPVPNLMNPFLGVHFTVTVDGHVKIGPTAIPAFWREQYNAYGNFRFSELVDIVVRQTGLFVHSGFDFRALALEELRKYYRPHLVSLAQSLASGVDNADYTRWGRPGIRAQLLNLKNRQLEMDFVLEGDEKSFHVLNTVSPGFTCSIPFSHYVCDSIEQVLH